MTDVEQFQQFHRQLGSVHQSYAERLREENRAWIRRFTELQQELERKAAALRESERRLTQRSVPLDARASEALRDCLQSIQTWRQRCGTLEAEWGTRCRTLEQQYEADMNQLQGQNQALLCRLRCAANNRRFLKDVNARLNARVEELDGQLTAGEKPTVRFWSEKENRRTDHTGEGLWDGGPRLRGGPGDAAPATPATPGAVPARSGIDAALHKQLQLRVEEIAALERELRQEREKSALQQTALKDKEAEMQRLHQQLQTQLQAAEQRQRVLGDQLAERDGLLGIEARERRATEHTAAALQLALEEERQGRAAARDEVQRCRDATDAELQAVRAACQAHERRCEDLHQALADREQQRAAQERAAEAAAKDHTAQLAAQADRLGAAQQLLEMQLAAAKEQLAEAQRVSRDKDGEVAALRDRLAALQMDSAQAATELLVQKERLLGELRACQGTVAALEAEVQQIRNFRDHRCQRSQAECDALTQGLRTEAASREEVIALLQGSVAELQQSLAVSEQRCEEIMASKLAACDRLDTLSVDTAEAALRSRQKALLAKQFGSWRLALCQRRWQATRLQLLQAKACGLLVRHVSVPRRQLLVYLRWDRVVRGYVARERQRVQSEALLKRFGRGLTCLRATLTSQRLQAVRQVTRSSDLTEDAAAQTDHPLHSQATQTGDDAGAGNAAGGLEGGPPPPLAQIHREVLAILESLKASGMQQLEHYERTTQHALDAQRQSTDQMLGALRARVDEVSAMLAVPTAPRPRGDPPPLQMEGGALVITGEAPSRPPPRVDGGDRSQPPSQAGPPATGSRPDAPPAASAPKAASQAARVEVGRPAAAALQLSPAQHHYQYGQFTEQVMMRVHLQQLQSALLPASSTAAARAPSQSVPEPSTSTAAELVRSTDRPGRPAKAAGLVPPATADRAENRPQAAPQPRILAAPQPTPQGGHPLIFTSTLSHLQRLPHTTRLSFESHQSPASLAARAQAVAAQPRQPRSQPTRRGPGA